MSCDQPSRTAYRAGCRCAGCRTAERAYRARYRRRCVEGAVIWGRHVPAGETWRKLLALTTEYESWANVARALRLRNGHVHFRGRPRVTVKTYAKVARLFHQMHEG